MNLIDGDCGRGCRGAGELVGGRVMVGSQNKEQLTSESAEDLLGLAGPVGQPHDAAQGVEQRIAGGARGGGHGGRDSCRCLRYDACH